MTLILDRRAPHLTVYKTLLYLLLFIHSQQSPERLAIILLLQLEETEA